MVVVWPPPPRNAAVMPGKWGQDIAGFALKRRSGSLLVKLFAFPISRYLADETILAIAITVHGEHADGGGEIQPCHRPCV